MSRSNRASSKLESSTSAAVISGKSSTLSGKQTRVSSSVSNVSRTSTRSTLRSKTGSESGRKDAKHFSGMSQVLEEELNDNRNKEAEHSLCDDGGNKCFDDWKDFYIQIFGNLKNKSDLIIAFTHYMLMKNGFRCLGLGDDKTYAENEEGSINLPEGWNHLFPKYAIRYIYNRMLHLLLAIHLDHRLLINLLNTRTNVVTNVTVFPEITVRSTCGGPINVLIPNPEKLAQSLYSNVIQSFTDSKACQRPPRLLSGSSQKNNPWEELEVRQRKLDSLRLEEDSHLSSNKTQENENQDIKNQDIEIHDIEDQDIEIHDLEDQDVENENIQKDVQAQNGEEPKIQTSSFNKHRLSKRTSWADQQPQTASATSNNSTSSKSNKSNKSNSSKTRTNGGGGGNNKKVKALKSSLDKAVPHVKDAIVCYVESMVNNWFGTYGKEIMKSGKMAIQNLAEQRQMIEKYMHLAKPVTEPKGGFVIYNSKVTLKDSKHRLLRESIEKDLEKLKVTGTNVYEELTKHFTEVAHKSSEVVDPKNKGKKLFIDIKRPEPKKQSELTEKERTRAQKRSLKQVQAKVDTGSRRERTSVKPMSQAQKQQATAKVTSEKIKFQDNKVKSKQIEKVSNISNKEQKAESVSRKEGGSETKSKSTQQNTTIPPNAAEKPKRKRAKAKSPTTSPQQTNVKTAIGKLMTQVKFSGSNPIKRIRFELPTKRPTTSPPYLSNKWPATYKSLETILKTSTPFSAKEREPGGYELNNESFDSYDSLQKDLNPADTPTISQTAIESPPQNGCGSNENDLMNLRGGSISNFSLRSIEEHFASQIEAKRLELLEMVRRRELENRLRRAEDEDMRNKVIQSKLEEEKDVGCFVPPADEWSLWEFKKKLAEIREKEMFGLNNKKITFKN